MSKSKKFVEVTATAQPTSFQLVKENTRIEDADAVLNFKKGSVIQKTSITEKNPNFQDVIVRVYKEVHIKLNMATANSVSTNPKFELIESTDTFGITHGVQEISTLNWVKIKNMKFLLDEALDLN